MPTEAELRAFLRGLAEPGGSEPGGSGPVGSGPVGSGPVGSGSVGSASSAGSARTIGSTLNLAGVIRRSRRRRRDRQLVVSGAATLAVASLGFGGFTGLQALGPGSPALNEASGPPSGAPSAVPGGGERSTGSNGLAAGGGAEGGIELAPDWKLNFCGAPLAEVSPSPTGLVLTAEFPDAGAAPGEAAPVEAVPGRVILTNTGPDRVVGTTGGRPAVTLSQDGIVLWHTNGPATAIAVTVDLDPGESMEYPASVLPVRCDTPDDSAESFRTGLPALAAGTYQVSAVMDLLRTEPAGAEGGPERELITGPQTTVTLR